MVCRRSSEFAAADFAKGDRSSDFSEAIVSGRALWQYLYFFGLFAIAEHVASVPGSILTKNFRNLGFSEWSKLANLAKTQTNFFVQKPDALPQPGQE